MGQLSWVPHHLQYYMLFKSRDHWYDEQSKQRGFPVNQVVLKLALHSAAPIIWLRWRVPQTRLQKTSPPRALEIGVWYRLHPTWASPEWPLQENAAGPSGPERHYASAGVVETCRGQGHCAPPAARPWAKEEEGWRPPRPAGDTRTEGTETPPAHRTQHKCLAATS